MKIAKTEHDICAVMQHFTSKLLRRSGSQGDFPQGLTFFPGAKANV
jgi:hypothetical protein